MTTSFWIQDFSVLFTGVKDVNSFIPRKNASFAMNINAFTRTVLLLSIFLFVFGRLFSMGGGTTCFTSLPQTIRLIVSILLGLGLISLIALMSNGNITPENYLYASPALPGAQFKADENQTLFSGKSYKEPYFSPPRYKNSRTYEDSKFMFVEPEAERDDTENYSGSKFFGKPRRRQNTYVENDANALLKRYKTIREPYPEPSGGNGNPSIKNGDEMSRIGNRVAYNRVTKPRTIDASNLTYNERGIKYRPYRYNSQPWFKK